MLNPSIYNMYLRNKQPGRESLYYSIYHTRIMIIAAATARTYIHTGRDTNSYIHGTASSSGWKERNFVLIIGSMRDMSKYFEPAATIDRARLGWGDE